MEEVLRKGQDKKYDFSNKESQRLFEEFTNLLGELSKEFEGLEGDDIEPVSPIKNYHSRELLKEVVIRFRNMLTVKADIFKKKLIGVFNIKK
jgi:hypothetical protein